MDKWRTQLRSTPYDRLGVDVDGYGAAIESVGPLDDDDGERHPRSNEKKTPSVEDKTLPATDEGPVSSDTFSYKDNSIEY